MKIIIAGGAGFLGKALENYFQKKGSEIRILTRNPRSVNDIFWDGKSLGNWKSELENAAVLINLAGKSVDCRYTEKNKNEILSSRIDSTKVLQEAMDQCENPPKIWLNASSATIYIHSENQVNTEVNGIIGDDFSMNICRKWEAEFFKTEMEYVRKVALRTSIVMGKEGGAFPKLMQISKLGLGGIQGKGNQFVSWIHLDDFCSAVDFIINNEQLINFVNVTAPNPLRNFEMMKTIREKINMPIGISSPTWLLEIASIFMQTETELLLKSRNVYPEKLVEAGFKFNYPNFKEALNSLCKY